MNIKTNKDKLQAKDFINIGIYSALLIVMYFFASFTNLAAVTYMLYSPITAILGAIPFMMAMVKVPKKGALILFSIVPILFFLVIAGFEGVVIASFIALFSLIGDFILGKSRTDFMRLSLTYVIFSSWNAIGGQFRLFLFTDSYLEWATGLGLSESYIAFLRQYATLWMWGIIILSSVIAAVIGMVISRHLFSKHFKKAGVI